MFDSLRHRAAAHGPWPRRILALACLALAALSAVPRAGRAHGGATVPVAVAAAAFGPGHALVAHDVQVRRYPAALAPHGSLHSAAVLTGRRLATAVATGEPLTPARLVGRGLATGLAPGLVALTVLVDDPHVAEFVRAGDHVDLVAAAGDGTSRSDGTDTENDNDNDTDTDTDTDTESDDGTGTATSVAVLAVLAPGGTSGESGVGSAGGGVDTVDGAGAELVVAVPRRVGVRLARARALGPFTVFVTSP